ncbi:MAG: LamG domain-containing protein, partial [Clostridia bacterium]|nr:LamG domain-containing protein [Clostridia bacterium]
FAVSATDAVSGNRNVFLTTLGVADINTGVPIPNDADWHHIAVAYNVPAGIIYVYIDGQLAGVKQQSGGPNFAVQTTDLRGCLGRELGGASPTTGTVDRVRLWKGVLSPAQLDVPPAEPLPPLPTAELTWEIVDGELVLEWTGGTLEVSDQADTGWVAIRQASPLVVPLSETTGSKFYRLAQ